MATEEPRATSLGSIAGVRCSVLRTTQPWDADFDTLVVSVGETFGPLASAVRRRFPDAGWDSVDLGAITPGRPAVLELPSEEKAAPPTRRLVLVALYDP